MRLIIEGGAPLRGEARVPADKSILHRALIFSAIAGGEARITARAPGADNRSTAAVLRSLGVEIDAGEGAFTVRSGGVAAWRPPRAPLDCGNSGTTMRLMAGALCGAGVSAELGGDASLSKRPMGRVCVPLRQLGGDIAGVDDGGTEHAPLRIGTGSLRAGAYRTPVASAQIKSALLLAGVCGGVAVEIAEPERSRYYSERMLAAMGASVESADVKDGHRVRLAAGAALEARDVAVPGDISSAAFLLAAGLLVDGSEVTVRDVGLNATRTGLLEILEEIGGGPEVRGWREPSGEPVGDLIVTPRSLVATRPGDVPTVVGGDVIPRLIDELVILAAIASQAAGTTVIRDAAELRVKESDRISETVRLLGAFGVDAEARPDGLVITGPQALRPARLDVGSDHRVALTAAVLALGARGESTLERFDIAAVSFPDIAAVLASLGAKVHVEDE